MSTLSNECLICNRIDQINNGTNPYLVRELQTGYVVMCDFQLYRGYTIFLSKVHESELFDLEFAFATLYMQEMMMVAKAVKVAFEAQKTNCELLGNTDSHVHWHIIPRYGDDPDPSMPIWTLGKEVLSRESNRPTTEVLEELKKKLRTELDNLNLK